MSHYVSTTILKLNWLTYFATFLFPIGSAHFSNWTVAKLMLNETQLITVYISRDYLIKYINIFFSVTDAEYYYENKLLHFHICKLKT